MKTKLLAVIGLSCFSFFSVAQNIHGNTYNQSFSKAKKLMQKKIYIEPFEMKTIYCGATFDHNKKIKYTPSGFTTHVYKKRLKKWEAEHVVPAENFGRTFSEWRNGSPFCMHHGKSFRGRKCAEKANKEYRYMQSDLYNLFPAIGAVNAARQNYTFTMLPGTSSTFGTCDMHIDKTAHKAQPPRSARGVIARTYLYFEAVYPRYKMSNSQRNLMNVWDKQYPVQKWECERAEKIKHIQGNVNPIMATRCNY